MKCKSCGFENEYTEKYCFICGRALYNHLFSTDYTKDSKTEPVNQEKNTDSLSSLNTPKLETNRGFLDRLGPIGGETPPSTTASPEQSSEPTTPLPPKLEPNHTFYFANSAPTTNETQPTIEKPEISERPDITPSIPLSTADDGPSEAGQKQAQQTVSDVSDIPSEDSVGLRFSLDRFMHGNIPSAVNLGKLPEKSMGDTPDDAETSNDSVESTAAYDAPVGSGNQEDENGILNADFRGEDEAKAKDKDTDKTVESPAEPVSHQETFIDIHSLELSSVRSLSSLEYDFDHKNLSYNHSELMDDSPNVVVEPSNDEPPKIEFIDAPRQDENSAQPAFGAGDFNLGMNNIRAVEEEKSEISNHKEVAGVNTLELAEMEDENESPNLPQPAISPEILPEQPELDGQSAKPVFHLNGFMVVNDTTFVRPLSKSVLTPPITPLGGSEEVKDFASDIFGEMANPSDMPEEEPEFKGAEASQEYLNKTAPETNERESDEIVESEVISNIAGNITEEQNRVVFGASLASVDSRESAEDLALIDYTQEVSENSREYAEPYPAATDFCADSFQPRKETESGTLEDLDSIDAESSIGTDNQLSKQIMEMAVVEDDKTIVFEASSPSTETDLPEAVDEAGETDVPINALPEESFTAGTDELEFQSEILDSVPPESFSPEETGMATPESNPSAEFSDIEAGLPPESQIVNTWISDTETGFEIQENEPWQPVDERIEVVQESTDVLAIPSSGENETEKPAFQADLINELPNDQNSAEILPEPLMLKEGDLTEPDTSTMTEVSNESSSTMDDDSFVFRATETETKPYEVAGKSELSSSGELEESEILKQIIPENFLNESPVPHSIMAEDSSEPLPPMDAPVIEPEMTLIPGEETPEQVYGEFDDPEDLSVTEFNWLWKRYGATITDGAILGLPLGLVFSFLKADFVAFIFLFVMIYWLYSTMFEASALQATPGKLLFGLIVADHNGNRLNYLQANKRFFAKILSGVLLRVITEKKQCLHDVLSNSLVLGG